jgi:hypothetical protein
MQRSHRARPMMVGLALLLLLASAACNPPVNPPVSGRWTALPRMPFGLPAPSVLDCPAPDSCFGLGYGDEVAHWDGRAWTALPVSPPAGETWQFADISCPTTTTCLIAGGRTSPDTGMITAAVFLRWDGQRFTDIALDAQPLSALSCPEADWCLLYNQWDQHVMLQWDGTTFTPTPAPENTRFSDDGNDFFSCGAPTNCAANAYSVSAVGGRYPPILLHWDGRSWATITLRSTVPGTLAAGSLSCTGPSFCAAVGGALVYIGAFPLSGTPAAATWTPAGWSPFTSVSQATSTPANEGHGQLSCSSPTWCLTTGSIYEGSGPDRPTALAWTGTGWAAAPGVADFMDGAFAISCPPGSRACVASDSQSAWQFTPEG